MGSTNTLTINYLELHNYLIAMKLLYVVFQDALQTLVSSRGESLLVMEIKNGCYMEARWAVQSVFV